MLNSGCYRHFKSSPLLSGPRRNRRKDNHPHKGNARHDGSPKMWRHKGKEEKVDGEPNGIVFEQESTVAHIVQVILNRRTNGVLKDQGLDNIGRGQAHHGILKKPIEQYLFRHHEWCGGTAKHVRVKVVNHQPLNHAFVGA